MARSPGKRAAAGALAVAAAAGALFVALNVLLALGFWLKPSARPDEDDRVAAPVRIPVPADRLPGGWPLTVRADSVDCHADGPIVLPLAAPHALNDAARTLGLPPAEELARTLPGGRRADLAPLRRAAESACDGAFGR